MANHYFVEEDGRAKVFNFGWPKSPTYFFDWTKPQAVAWFTDLVRKWTAFGVDGFKEDVFGFGKYALGDDKLDPVDAALMREGLYIMGRNAYLGLSGGLAPHQRFQLRPKPGPRAGQLARAGVFGPAAGLSGYCRRHFRGKACDLKVTPRMRAYMMRNAQWASVHPSMSMGQGPWTFGDSVCRKAGGEFHAPIRFDRFLQSSSKLTGRIVMGKDFDSVLGTGHKVYLNVGANQGVKIGDFFRAVRSYTADLDDPVDSLSFKAAIAEDTQLKTPSVDPAMFTKGNGPVIHVRDLPRRAVGEIVIIGVTNTTATGMVVFSLEDVHAGDTVEADAVQQ